MRWCVFCFLRILIEQIQIQKRRNQVSIIMQRVNFHDIHTQLALVSEKPSLSRCATTRYAERRQLFFSHMQSSSSIFNWIEIPKNGSTSTSLSLARLRINRCDERVTHPSRMGWLATGQKWRFVMSSHHHRSRQRLINHHVFLLKLSENSFSASGLGSSEWVVVESDEKAKRENWSNKQYWFQLHDNESGEKSIGWRARTQVNQQPSQPTRNEKCVVS